MKVIVNESGFYAGIWRKAGSAEVEMHEKVAKPFLPPFGTQLSLPTVTAKPVAKTDRNGDGKAAESKAS